METYWRELQLFHIAREGNRHRFYRDARGLVTIGIGHLVDRGDGASHAQRRDVAESFARANASHFRTADGGRASPAQVLEDWERVHRGSVRVGQLQLPQEGIDALYTQRVRGYLDEMYNRRPFSSCLPPRIQMALVDARYNPARVSLYPGEATRGGDAAERRERESVRAMWSALDRDSPEAPLHYNPRAALELFRQIWRGRGGPVYQNRHTWRVSQFEQGVATMLADDESRFHELIDDLASGR
ncbi:MULTISPECIES: hypothetical protein [Sorangium]|uniref:hypothetical protein n=1 Tax=Sorangium TaxID=39643 RepID=UPI0012FF5D50|nr:hypothetical protein [Sorangium cellulosum]